jgi:twinkle protein
MGSKSIDLYLEDELQEEIDFALKHKIIKVIATHPPTPLRDKDKKFPAPSAFEIKGGEVWASMMYNLMCIHIPQLETWEESRTEIHIQKIKNQKLVGLPTRRDNPVVLNYNRRSGRYTDMQGTSPFDSISKQESIKFEQPYYNF